MNYKTPSRSPSILLTASRAQDHVELESIPAVLGREAHLTGPQCLMTERLYKPRGSNISIALILIWRKMFWFFLIQSILDTTSFTEKMTRSEEVTALAVFAVLLDQCVLTCNSNAEHTVIYILIQICQWGTNKDGLSLWLCGLLFLATRSSSENFVGTLAESWKSTAEGLFPSYAIRYGEYI